MIRFAAALAIALLPLAPANAETDVQEITSPGGITAWLVEEHTIPMIAVDAYFVGGPLVEPAEKAGATYLMSGLLEEGSGEMDAVAFAQATERLAARFGFDTSRDGVTISATMLTEFRDETVELLAQALTAPRFDDDAFARVKAQVLSSIERDQGDPNTIAGRRFAELSFGDHPYGRPLEGTTETVTALTPDDMRTAHQNALTRGRMFVAVVGDITAEEAGQMLDQLFGGLPAEGPELPAPVEPMADGSTTVVPFPSPQSAAAFGHGGIDRDDPDFLPAYVLNHIFGGGGFGSRLTDEVREKRGLTYGIGTYLSPGRLGDLYRGGVASANARMAETVEIVRAEWARLAEDGVTEEELARAKKYLTGAYPLRFDGNARIAGMLSGLQSVGLPLDYIKTRNAQIEAITLDEINRVARRLLHPDALRFVVVGQPEGLASTN